MLRRTENSCLCWRNAEFLRWFLFNLSWALIRWYWSLISGSGFVLGSGNTGKTVAIILGGAAGVGFLVICLLFARNLMKKHDGKYTRLYIPIIRHPSDQFTDHARYDGTDEYERFAVRSIQFCAAFHSHISSPSHIIRRLTNGSSPLFQIFEGTREARFLSWGGFFVRAVHSHWEDEILWNSRVNYGNSCAC